MTVTPREPGKDTYITVKKSLDIQLSGSPLRHVHLEPPNVVEFASIKHTDTSSLTVNTFMRFQHRTEHSRDIFSG